jgi:hypothetical protein
MDQQHTHTRLPWSGICRKRAKRFIRVLPASRRESPNTHLAASSDSTCKKQIPTTRPPVILRLPRSPSISLGQYRGHDSSTRRPSLLSPLPFSHSTRHASRLRLSRPLRVDTPSLTMHRQLEASTASTTAAGPERSSSGPFRRTEERGGNVEHVGDLD